MNISDLVIEVTRRCNMKCGHCLRGEPQNKTMCETHLRNLLRQTSYISNVTFTGGEPTLPSGLKMIEKFIDLCHAYNVQVGNWYIVTNALKWRSELPRILWRLNNLCCDNEVSAISISGDQYHETDSHDRNTFLWRLEEGLMEEGLYEEITIDTRGEIHNLIGQGRGWGEDPREESLTYDYFDNELNVMEATLHLNCNGDIILGCDWSYESQDTLDDIFLCKVEDSIEDAIKEKGIFEGEEECAA